jgi:hypothetical protein
MISDRTFQIVFRNVFGIRLEFVHKLDKELSREGNDMGCLAVEDIRMLGVTLPTPCATEVFVIVLNDGDLPLTP